MIDPLSNRKLQSLYHQLVCDAEMRRIPRADAEELANDTLMVVLREFDATRGTIATFSRTVLLNKIRNHVRDRKPHPELPDDEEAFVDDNDPSSLLTRLEDVETMKRVRSRLLSTLEPDEAAFLRQFEVVLDELGGRAVSETARRLELTPQEGHNIFQRIERKALALLKKAGRARPEADRSAIESLAELDRPLFARKIYDAEPPEKPALIRAVESDPAYLQAFARKGVDLSRRALAKFLGSLDETDTRKLLAFLS